MNGHGKLEEKNSPQQYTNNTLPCLVRKGAMLEDVAQVSLCSPEYYLINARNALRHLTYGTPLFKGSFFRRSNLKLAWLNFKALILKRDKNLLGALRYELKEVFKQAYLISKQCDSETQDRLEIFIDTLLSNFPFMDPEEGEEVEVPQRINNEWRLINYQFKKIDLSPKTGWWSKWLEEEDRIYAYGLEPKEADASPHLLLMGTTYLSGQGSTLSLLGDLTPGKSVGERHDLTELESWVKAHQHIKITGHSQGGTMAMIVAAQYPENTQQASCLNPAALHQATMARLSPYWHSPRQHQPEIKVYTQVNDPVFIFGDGFLSGTRIFRLGHANSIKSSKLAAHAHHYAGHASATVSEWLGYQTEVNSKKRKFFNDFKAIADRIVSPFLKLNFIYSICKRKILRFCSKHAVALRGFLFVASLAVCLSLLATGVLAPLGFALLLPIVKFPSVAFSIIFIGFLAASAVSTYLVPKLVSLAAHLTRAAVGLAAACMIGAALVLGSVAAGLNALKRACFDNKQVNAGPQGQQKLSAIQGEIKYLNQSTIDSLNNFGLNHPSSERGKNIHKKSKSQTDLQNLSLTHNAKVKRSLSTSALYCSQSKIPQTAPTQESLRPLTIFEPVSLSLPRR